VSTACKILVTHQNSPVASYDNWNTVFTSPRPADAAQYVKNRSGVMASASPRVNFWRVYKGSDGKSRYAQGTVRPGASLPLDTNYPVNESSIFTITVYLSQGITSRGSIGIDSNLHMNTIVNPWFEDPTDQTVLITALQDVINSATSGAYYRGARACRRGVVLMSNAVSGLQLVVPDNTTTLANYVQTYPPSSLSSNHWVGSNQIGSVVDANLKVIGMNNLVRVMDAPRAGKADAPIVRRGRFYHACLACRQPSRCSHVCDGARRCEDPRAFRWALMSFLGVWPIVHLLHSNASAYVLSSNVIYLEFMYGA
jgi:cellobiose dehydrogenase (acceptor)